VPTIIASDEILTAQQQLWIEKLLEADAPGSRPVLRTRIAAFRVRWVAAHGMECRGHTASQSGLADRPRDRLGSTSKVLAFLAPLIVGNTNYPARTPKVGGHRRFGLI
jgi:hypothetical protein